jgi:hypothetical protein
MSETAGGHTMSHNSSSAQQNYSECTSALSETRHRRSFAYLTTCDGRAERIVADTNFFVHNGVCKVVLATSHSADEDSN